MDFNELYEKIVLKIKENPKDIKTVPLNRTGLCFYTYIEDNKIFIQPSKTKLPTSSVKKHTQITKASLEKMYPLYLRRKNGEKVSKEAKKLSFVQVYCYAIFENYGETL